VGRARSVGGGTDNRYQFFVPGLQAGDRCNLMVRDDEGKYHTAYNQIVGSFAAQLVKMEVNGIWLQWASVPDRTYGIYRAEQLGGAWTQVKRVTAVEKVTREFVSFDPMAGSGFYKIVLLP